MDVLTAYIHSRIRTKALSRWLHRYNNHRPHSAFGGRTPAKRQGNGEQSVDTLHLATGDTARNPVSRKTQNTN
ncbi:integrase core domain-containing protein [Nitratidesulfovibrio sp. D1]|uniref:integrase core domain-containing protein n=1 Tax=Nitratidesulfovibrio sp. D1 TaxID=3440151 RepID=UPI003EBBC10F